MPGALTLERAGELLARLLPACGPVCAVSRFAEGSVTGAYRIEFADAGPAPVVLKIYADKSPWSAAKEARALRFLTGHGFGISPRVLAFSRSAGALGGRPCLVCSLCPGRMLTELDAELTRAQRYEVYRQLGEVLKRLHAIPAGGYGDVNGQILNPLPDNSAYMARMLKGYLRGFRANGGDPALAGLAAHVTRHASEFAECSRPAYCHGDLHEDNLLAEVAEDGTCSLTGLLDPDNMYAGDPLMDFVRLDAFSVHGDATKMAGLLSGYGVCVPRQQPGKWPESWRSRLPLYRIALALELYNWYTIIGETSQLPALDRELRELLGDAAAGH